jgi:hypothetical protein
MQNEQLWKEPPQKQEQKGAVSTKKVEAAFWLGSKQKKKLRERVKRGLQSQIEGNANTSWGFAGHIRLCITHASIFS